MEAATIVWTEYMEYRLSLRGYDLATVEQILRYSSERYVDTGDRACGRDWPTRETYRHDTV
jgi:hypothetical protein